MARFPTTRWSLIQSASRELATGPRENLGRLLDQYWQPMFMHLRHKGVSSENAEDLIQEFALELLQGDLLAYADADRGKFRTLLLTALDRFAISRHRYATAAKRSPGAVASLDQREGIDPAGQQAHPGLIFDRAWGVDVLAETLTRMQRECESEKHAGRWKVFEERILGPLLEDREPTSFAELVAHTGSANEKGVMNMLVTAKRQFSRLLREVVREYMVSEDRQRSSDATSHSPADSESELAIEHAIHHAVAREIQDLQVMLAKSRSVREFVPDMACDFEHKDPLKGKFWRRLTEIERVTNADLGEMFDVGKAGEEPDDSGWEQVLSDIIQSPIGRLVNQAGPNGETLLGDLLLASQADIPLLSSVKDWANIRRFGGEGTLPRAVASGIYFLTLAAALVRGERRITGLDTVAFAAGIQWSLDQAWIPGEFSPLLQQCLAKLNSDTLPHSK